MRTKFVQFIEDFVSVGDLLHFTRDYPNTHDTVDFFMVQDSWLNLKAGSFATVTKIKKSKYMDHMQVSVWVLDCKGQEVELNLGTTYLQYIPRNFTVVEL